MAMALYAVGFNAWNQLELSPGPKETEPEDLWQFTKVLEAEHLERPKAELSYTIVRSNSALHVAGAGVPASSPHALNRLYTTCRASNGLVVAVSSSPPQDPSGDHHDATAVASNHILEVHASHAEFASNAPPKKWPCESRVGQVVAFDAGFLVLHENGSVATFGDARYQDCLARQVTDDLPADQPGLVLDLKDLDDPVKHVAAGGLTLAALTESGSIYVWGRGSAGGRRQEGGAFEHLESSPNYCEVDGGKDIRDVALGESHAIALTTEGSVYVIGSNSNGKLGLGRECKNASTWTKVELDRMTNHHIVSVAAGPRCSFILTSADA